MSTEENKALIRRIVEELWNQGNLGLADELVAPDYVGHDPTSPDEHRGPEGLKQYVATSRSAFPDWHMRIEEQVAEGDLVATRWTATGTQKGEMAGIPPTGKRVRMPGTSIDRFSEGRLVETWDSYDALGVMQQLGVIPAPE